MREEIKRTRKLPPEDQSAVLQAKESVKRPGSEITPDSSPKEVIARLEARGTQSSRNLAEALRNLHKHRDEKRDPQQKQMDLDL
jgi:hypothetical protein